MKNRSAKPFEAELQTFTIGVELTHRLADLVATARADHKPRNFAECQLVDDLAITRWRGFRVAIMEKAIFEHEAIDFTPRALKDEDGVLFEPHEDMYHFAMAHSPERHATVLAAIHRLEARYHRQFCTCLRLLIALRRGTPPPVTSTPAETELRKANSTTTSTRKETTTCEPSPTTPLTM